MDWRNRLNSYKDLYSEYNDFILSNPDRFTVNYKFKSRVRELGMSPIEDVIWDICQCNSIALYPQYPVARYMVDFCNPSKKIILECDGKDYHDINRDSERDDHLVSLGWKVFRLTGSKIHKDHSIITDKIDQIDDYKDDDHELNCLYKDYYINTAEGFLESLKELLFIKNPLDRNIFRYDDKLCSLLINRINHSFQVMDFPEILKD